MNAYKLADELETLHWLEGDGSVANCPFQAQATMLRQQADRIAELEKDGKVCATCGGLVYDPVIKQTKPLSDEVLNKAFDYYCETDEGVLRFNYELRDEWKKEQLIRWKEALKKASEK